MDTYRYLIDFDTDKMPKEYFDILIVGSGIAGVYTALELDEKYNIAVLTKEEVEISNSVLAQGGIAVSLDKNDSPDMHMKDTLYAGAGLCNEKSVRVLVDEAAKNISRVCNYGVNFDKSDNKETLALGREAAHSTNRIIHAGDSTGKAVCDTLIHKASQRKNISIHERIWVLDLLVKDQRCYGVIALDEKTNTYKCFYAGMVICAAGGYGQLYTYTTNPEVSTGDGACGAYRAGTPLMDMEFVQFHPTVLYHKDNRSFLISEAVRGDGAVLRNAGGERFMPNYHELAELAPRDVVSRSIFKEMKRTGEPHMWLDITHKDRDYLEHRFPMIFSTCLSYGIDMSKDYIPIAPAEHYCMGGIKTGIFGETEIKNFFACGETACNGIHGANRLASNSLLEGLVFGHRIGAQAEELLSGAEEEMPHFSYTAERKPQPADYEAEPMLRKLKETMTHLVGIERNKEGLTEALKIVKEMRAHIWNMENKTSDDFIVQNDTMLAQLIIESAIQREESRGAHYRSDFPERDDANWQHNIEKGWRTMLNYDQIDRVIRLSLEEDMPFGDITTENIISEDSRSSARFIAKEDGILAGMPVAERTFYLIDPTVKFTQLFADGSPVHKGDVIALVEGPTGAILKGERTALNLLQRLSGVATRTHGLAKLIADLPAKVVDTRKTTPGLRYLEKYAVRAGGGQNHRFSLSDGVLIKDNHIAAAGGIKPAVAAVRGKIPHTIRIEVETESLEMVQEALEAGADIIMLDNMTDAQMAEAVKLIAGRALTEASGDINEERIRRVAETGVDIISVGRITHSVKSLDISLKF